MIKQKARKVGNFILLFLFISISACNSATESDEGMQENEGPIVDSATVEKAQINKAKDLVGIKDQSELNESQLNVQQLLESCVANDYEAAAKLIMYRGADKSRMGFDSFNSENSGEAQTVKVTCEVISSWLGSSQSYEFISYQEEDTELGLQYVVEVMFKKEKLGVERHFFYFMDSPKGKLLVNMV